MHGNSHLTSVPGLNRTIVAQDLENSRAIYNALPDDSKQPRLSHSHLQNMAALFVRHGAERVFDIHLAHAHFAAPQGTALLGTNYVTPHCRWVQSVAVCNLDFSNVHGHVFVLTDQGFHPYEYQAGPMHDLSKIDDRFLLDFAAYLDRNQLSTLVGLQVLESQPRDMLEFVLPQGTIMLDTSDVTGCISTRQTGWQFFNENGETRVCQKNESHGQTVTTHEIFNKGSLHPKLETFQDLVVALKDVGVLCAI